MAHGDYCDYNNYVERHVDLTSDVDVLVDFAETVPKTGGGDSPEVCLFLTLFNLMNFPKPIGIVQFVFIIYSKWRL